MPKLRPYQRPWKESGRREQLIKSGARLLQFVLDESDIDEVYRTHVLRDVLWAVTEMDGKYETRYRSRGALELEKDGPNLRWQSHLRHDHVVTRKVLADRLRAGEDPEAVLRDALACVVTREEHDRLSKFDRTLEGWERYRAGDVEVIDMASGERLMLRAE